MFKIVNEDITKMDVDAIVNAGNTSLQMGGGVCGAIFNAAGASDLREACRDLAPIKTGDAVITDGFKLPARYIIHTAGPIYNVGDVEKSRKLLATAYANSLEVAKENEVKSLAFPLLSSGIYGYPKYEAYEVAADAINEFLANNEMDIYLTILDEELFKNLINN